MTRTIIAVGQPQDGSPFKPYEVHIGPGLLGEAAQLIKPFVTKGKAIIIADHHVAPLYAEALAKDLQALGTPTHTFIVPAGEASKSWAQLQAICDHMLSLRFERHDLVIALGGGVVGDLAGFASSIYMRGIDFVQIPTSLLAQVDSSVGGKTAIDHGHYKNMIGAFHQPRLVLCDTDVLTTLPKREFRAGYAEVIKYAFLGDRQFFQRLQDDHQSIFDQDKRALTDMIAHCVRMKAEIVAKDEREKGLRALLNLGHTFGHALEAECGFGDTLLHGEAVAIGSALAFRYSQRFGHCSAQDAQLASDALMKAGLDSDLKRLFETHQMSADTLIDHMRHDKKSGQGTITLILVKALGDAYSQNQVDETQLRDFLIEEGALA